MTTQTQISDKSGSLWEPRRTLTLEAARAHTRRVQTMRGLLMVVALICVGLLVWEFMQQEEPGFETVDSSQSVKMVNPRYSGRTDDGLPFYLTANEAVRMVSDDNKVELIDPVLEFIREENAEKSIVTAKSGTYDDTNKILNLRADVVLNTDDGYNCQTTHARVFAKTKIIEGDEPISCTGAFGRVKGNAYEIVDGYKTFIFKGGMNAVLETEE